MKLQNLLQSTASSGLASAFHWVLFPFYEMAASLSSRRLFRPLLYISAGAAIGGAGLYLSYRPKNIPGQEGAAVPPPRYGEGGEISVPRFPLVKKREEQIADLKKSSSTQDTAQKTKSVLGSLRSNKDETSEEVAGDGAEPYDLLIIGGGATGAGVALDAVTRGLKVAMVERDDFASGTSSKSTKLVHGGVRYLEKAVWELDYNQSVGSDVNLGKAVVDSIQV